jgi:hypothetical protein
MALKKLERLNRAAKRKSIEAQKLKESRPPKKLREAMSRAG